MAESGDAAESAARVVHAGRPAGDAATVEETVTRALRELMQRFDDTEKLALAAAPDGVHQHRTAVRRMRGVLHVFGDIYEPHAVARALRELKQWGTVLGVVRDREVAAELAETLLDRTETASTAEVRARLIAPERDALRAAHHRLVALHEEERYRSGRRFLHEFVASPPVVSPDARPFTELRMPLLRQGRKTVRKARRLDGSLSRHHQLRKRARRLRHATEAVMSEPPDPLGNRMRRVAKAAHRVQSVLGDHRDALLLATSLERTRVLAGRAGEETRVYDLLEQAALDSATTGLRKLPKANKKLKAAVVALGE